MCAENTQVGPFPQHIVVKMLIRFISSITIRTYLLYTNLGQMENTPWSNLQASAKRTSYVAQKQVNLEAISSFQWSSSRRREIHCEFLKNEYFLFQLARSLFFYPKQRNEKREIMRNSDLATMCHTTKEKDESCLGIKTANQQHYNLQLAWRNVREDILYLQTGGQRFPLREPSLLALCHNN